MTTAVLHPQTIPAHTAAQSRSGVVRGLLFDTLVPWGVYTAATHGLGCSTMQALMLSAAVPLAAAARTLHRREGISPVTVLVVLGIAASAAAMLLGGSARVFLLRESLLTVLLGLVCFASLPTRRPLMFFFMRHFVAGSDALKLRSFDARWSHAGFRRAVRTGTAVWGGVFLLEFAVRAWLVLHCSVSTVLLVSPVLMNGMVGAAVAWNVWYGKRQRAMEQV